MDDEIELINDGHGIAILGKANVVDKFLAGTGLSSRDLELKRLTSSLTTASNVLQTGAAVSESAGRWVKLTEQSARAMKAQKLMKGSHPGVSRAIVTQDGKISGILEIVKSPGSLLSNPAVLTGAAGLMAQVAMQQSMDQVLDYLARIDEKVDDILRAQKDAVLADMIGVDLVIDEALAIRKQVGHVSEVTWSKVQSTAATIARTQAYALRQIEALADQVERDGNMGDLADGAKELASHLREWLAVIARCFQLQDAIAVLELDRVLETAPGEIEDHRVALEASRQHRQDLILQTTDGLLGRIVGAATYANSKVLLHPLPARSIVESSNVVSSDLAEFHRALDWASDVEELTAKRWVEAAADTKDRVLEAGSDHLETVAQAGSKALGHARSAAGRLTGAMRSLRSKSDEPESEGES